MEYALSLAVKAGELNPHDASQTLAFWNEAEVFNNFVVFWHPLTPLLQALFPGNEQYDRATEKLRKSLGAQFGPRANSIYDTVIFLS